MIYSRAKIASFSDMLVISKRVAESEFEIFQLILVFGTVIEQTIKTL